MGINKVKIVRWGKSYFVLGWLEQPRQDKNLCTPKVTICLSFNSQHSSSLPTPLSGLAQLCWGERAERTWILLNGHYNGTAVLAALLSVAQLLATTNSSCWILTFVFNHLSPIKINHTELVQYSRVPRPSFSCTIWVLYTVQYTAHCVHSAQCTLWVYTTDKVIGVHSA